MRKTPFTLIFLIFLLMAGCQSFFPAKNGQNAKIHNAVERDRSEARQISKLLNYYSDLSRLDEEQLKIRLAQLPNSQQAVGCSTDRLKSAMILSRLSAHHNDIDLATVLDPCLNKAFIQSSAKGQLALLLRNLIATRRVASGAQAEIKNYHHQLEALQDENQKLHKQLEGLKAIEKSIQQRNRH